MVSKLKKLIMMVRLYYRHIFKIESNFSVPFFKRIKYNAKGFTTDQIVLYNFDENDYRDYLTEIDRWKTRKINKEFRFLLDNKLIFTNYFKDYIRIPEIIFYTFNGYVYNSLGKSIDEDEFNKQIESHNKLIFKPIGTGGGRGVILLEKKDNKIYIDDKETSASKVYNSLIKLDNYIVNEYVFQHTYAATIYPFSVNSIRILTFFQNGEPKIYSATHRFGSKSSSHVDNISSGGFFANISLDDGMIGPAKTYLSTHSFNAHPDTNAQIKGIKIPEWDSIKSMVLRFSKKFPYIPYLAWDIVLNSKSEIIVLEINASTGLTFLQMEESLKGTELHNFFKEQGID